MKMLKILCILVLVAGMVSTVFAQEAERSAEILSLKGEVEVKIRGEGKWGPAKAGMVLAEGDIIKTKSNSRALLNLDGGETASVELEENSELLFLELVKYKKKGTQKTLLDLAVGEILIKAKKLHTPESSFEVKTPTSVVGVRGTEFAVKVEALE